MPIHESEWASIAELAAKIAARVSGRVGDHFFVSKVIKNDTTNNVIYIKELKDIPIPLFAFDYEVKYYDESPRGTGLSFGAYKTYTKYAKVRVLCPEVGDVVLICREMGVDSMPRCLGVLKSTNFSLDEVDDDAV